MWETWIWFLGREVPLEEGMTTHFSTLAWRTPWTEEPGCVQSMGLQKVRYDWETKHSTVRAYKILWFCNRLLVRPLAGEGNGNPLQYSCLEKSHAWRILVGCSPWGLKESEMTERLHFHFSLSCIGEGNGTHSSVLAWRIPGMVEPGGLPSLGSHRVGHDWSHLAAAAAAAAADH